MRRLRKFFLLPSTERGMLLKSAIVLATVRIGLLLLPFRVLRKALARIIRAEEAQSTDFTAIKKISWAIGVVSNNVPLLKNCLAEALTTQVLLRHEGYPSRLRIGVALGEKGELKAHAWVEAGGEIIIGGTESPSRFVPLLLLEK